MYYIEENSKIVLFDEDRKKLENTIVFMPQYKGLEILDTDRPIIDFEFADTEEWAEKQAAKERERINGLKVTKRVFALALQELGITYSQLKSLIEANEQAQLEWDLCVELERSNPLLDIMAEETGLLTSEMLDYIFQKANGEEVDMPVVKENTEDETIEE